MSTALVVDDSQFMRSSICELLRRKNLASKIFEAADGVQAVKVYKNVKPDVVTMDIDMPKANGIQALRAIKKIDSRAKIIVITGNLQSSMKNVSKFGAIGYLTKPINETDAAWVISTALEQKS